MTGRGRGSWVGASIHADPSSGTPPLVFLPKPSPPATHEALPLMSKHFQDNGLVFHLVLLLRWPTSHIAHKSQLALRNCIIQDPFQNCGHFGVVFGPGFWMKTPASNPATPDIAQRELESSNSNHEKALESSESAACHSTNSAISHITVGQALHKRRVQIKEHPPSRQVCKHPGAGY